MSHTQRIILIDGTAMVYRAYYALPSNLTTAAGLHTNAIYGLAAVIRKLLGGRRPDYVGVIFDAPGRTFRDERYSEYKAQRPPMKGDLREQLPHIDRLVAAHRFVALRVPGYEADDVIGTLAKQAEAAGIEVIIVSPDKDFVQLISPAVRMYDPIRDVTYDEELASKKWGVPPRQFVDFLALMGDKVDNIPGVPGIGKKSAATLLATYGDLDGVLANVHELKGRQRSALTTHNSDALLSRELATIDLAVPLDVSVSDLVYREPDAAAVNTLYRELEFYSLLSDAELQAAGADRHADKDYAPVEDVGEFLTSLETTAEASEDAALVVLTESPSPLAGNIAGIAVATNAGHARYLPWSMLSGTEMSRLRAMLEAARGRWVTHDLKSAWVAMHSQDINLSGVHFDTMLASYLIDPTKLVPHRLNQLVKEYLHRTLEPIKGVIGSGKTQKLFRDVPIERVSNYACHLADAIFELHPILAARTDQAGQTAQLTQRDMPLAETLGHMEIAGIRVDPDDLRAMGEEFATEKTALEEQVYVLAGSRFNLGSTKQLAKVLFDDLGLPVIKRTKTGYSTNAEVLATLATQHELPKLVLQQRALAKLINTYTDVLQRAVNPQTGRVHATFQQAVGASGRIISTDPDLQRTPIRTARGRRVRRAFIADPGHVLISADWSQIELRVLAHFSQDPRLIEAFEENIDVHRRTASQLFECTPAEVTGPQRDVGKTINFATIYGQGATALSKQLGISRNEAKRYISEYFAYYANVRTWLDRTIAEAHEHGYVTTILGRRRFVPELSSSQMQTRLAGERIAANTPIQGSAADLCKLAMLNIDAALRQQHLKTRMLLQIHDELVFEVPVDEVDTVTAIVQEGMEHVMPLRVPLVVDIGVGPNWAAAKG